MKLYQFYSNVGLYQEILTPTPKFATGYWENAYCNCVFFLRSLHNQDYVKLSEKLLLICTDAHYKAISAAYA